MGSRAMGTPMAIEMDKEAGSGMPWQVAITRNGGDTRTRACGTGLGTCALVVQD